MKQIKSEDDDESEDQVHKDDEDEDDPRWPWWMAVGWLDEWLDVWYNGIQWLCQDQESEARASRHNGL